MVLIVLALVGLIFRLFKKDKDKVSVTLGKVKKRTTKQLPLDFSEKAKATQEQAQDQSKYNLVNEIIAIRSRQREYLRAARNASPERAKELKKTANELHIQAKKKEKYFNQNYAVLKGYIEDALNSNHDYDFSLFFKNPANLERMNINNIDLKDIKESFENRNSNFDTVKNSFYCFGYSKTKNKFLNIFFRIKGSDIVILSFYPARYSQIKLELC